MRILPKFLTRRALLCAALLIVNGASQCFAGAIATPPGVWGGQQFRIVFVTPNTTNATSSNISDYDDFVNAQAGGATYNGVTVQWQAMASTNAVNARDHVGQTGTAVYLADGTKVANSDTTAAGGLWSAGGLQANISQDLDGNDYSGLVWTGSSGIGTTYATIPVPGDPPVQWGLGSSGFNGNNKSETGSILGGIGGYTWLSIPAGVQLNTDLYQVYGISEVLTAVPEPSSFLMSGIGLVAIGFVTKLRRRQAVGSETV
ncbi:MULTISPECIES: PEP-CTERM sorting domain-containing protein [unclassified Schlesneria]|uniref:PEP-CTERM sorting domain-containing protein n=1 Tax=Schlesneria TaxID=656899 RepID=UPI00359FBB86